MNPSTKRKFRRFKYKAKTPVMYVTLLVTGLILFLAALHSCSQTHIDAAPRGVQYTNEGR